MNAAATIGFLHHATVLRHRNGAARNRGNHALQSRGSQQAIRKRVGIRLVRRRKMMKQRMPEIFFSFGVRKAVDLDPAHERAVLRAFAAAVKTGKPKAECYLAAVAAWPRLHPHQQYSRAANIAVCIVLDRALSRSAEMGDC